MQSAPPAPSFPLPPEKHARREEWTQGSHRDGGQSGWQSAVKKKGPAVVFVFACRRTGSQWRSVKRNGIALSLILLSKS